MGKKLQDFKDAHDPSTIITNLRAEMSSLRQELDEANAVKIVLGTLAAAVDRASIPQWSVSKPKEYSGPGIPTLMLSDLHWAERVDPNQINGVNEYNLTIARRRLRHTVESAIHLCRILDPGFRYPGIVVPLGGDMISGNIHDELTATNEINSMPAILDLYGELIRAIKLLADAFGNVLLPCVTGNHGRDTRKIWSKDRHATSFDWLLYMFLAKHFADDQRIRFLIPEGPDIGYHVYGLRYLLTHGDKLGHGGDGLIGFLGPVSRGDHKRRSRNAQINQPYDTLICGHWHQYAHLSRLIVNGCFPKNTKVLTNTGYNAISTISVGDFVMSKDGSKQEVTHVFEKTAERLIGLKVFGLPDVLQATPNHLVWAIKRASGSADVTPVRRHMRDKEHGPAQWIPIDFLSPGDYVHVPFPVGDEAPIDAETAWAYGLYLAEGSTLLDAGSSKKHNRICLTMHDRELSVLRRWADWFENTYNKKPHVFTRIRGTAKSRTSELTVSPGREVCVKFREAFGHRAGGKHLPEGSLFWRDELKAALVRGWIDGDGHSAKKNDSRPTLSATTISEQLAWGMFYLARATKAYPTLSKLGKGGPRKNDTYQVHFNTGQNVVVVGDQCFYKIAERFESDRSCAVFDLEVSGEHTYTAAGVGVHNSLKGYDEFAFTEAFPFEPPQQALWITHYLHGMTYRMPVRCDAVKAGKGAPEWDDATSRQ